MPYDLLAHRKQIQSIKFKMLNLPLFSVYQNKIDAYDMQMKALIKPFAVEKSMKKLNVLLVNTFSPSDIEELERKGIMPFIRSYMSSTSKYDDIQFGRFFGAIKIRTKHRLEAQGFSSSVSSKLIKIMDKVNSEIDAKKGVLPHQFLDDDLSQYLNADDLSQYLSLQASLHEEQQRIEALKEQLQISIDKDMLEHFSFNEPLVDIAEPLDDLKTLSALCAEMKNKNIEIILFPDLLDEDLLSVAHMKIIHAEEKGNEVIFMTSEMFDQIIAEQGFIEGVNKLSFLHHNHDSEFYDDYVKKIGTYVKNMPALKDIVLRGCGTAADVSLDDEARYKVKVSERPVVGVQGEQSLVLHQKEADGVVYTDATWAQIDASTKERHVHTIEGITDIPQVIGKKLSAEHIEALNQVEGIPLLRNVDISREKKKFFDEKQSLTKDELAKVKRFLPRAKTANVVTSGEDLLSTVVANMTEKQRQQVSVKAYIGGYKVSHDRVIPDDEHGRKNLPKALRIGKKRSRQFFDEKKASPTSLKERLSSHKENDGKAAADDTTDENPKLR